MKYELKEENEQTLKKIIKFGFKIISDGFFMTIAFIILLASIIMFAYIFIMILYYSAAIVYIVFIFFIIIICNSIGINPPEIGLESFAIILSVILLLCFLLSFVINCDDES